MQSAEMSPSALLKLGAALARDNLALVAVQANRVW
jgi:hypothetical protein|eukprot:COSAG06_NODE_3322_length_5507_cov_6.531435_2_plen_35_part_00